MAVGSKSDVLNGRVDTIMSTYHPPILGHQLNTIVHLRADIERVLNFCPIAQQRCARLFQL
jgi:hypothetical protein